MSADDDMQRQIDRLRALARLVPGGAPAVADAMRGVIVDNIASGVGPDGVPWAPTEEGRVALRGAAKALDVRALDTVVVATLTGVEARHHLGAVRGGEKREILPTGASIPRPMVDAIGEALAAEFKRTMGPAAR